MANNFKIGLSNLHYALMTDEGTASTPPTYSAPVPLAPAITASITNNQEVVNAYADDRVIATAKGAISADVTLETSEIPTDVVAALLGQTVDAQGALNYSDDASSPNVALLFEAALDGGGRALFVFHKGQFNIAEESFATKGETVEFQNASITGTFVSPANGVWKRVIRTDDAGVNQTVIDNWFTSVYDGSAPV